MPRGGKRGRSAGAGGGMRCLDEECRVVRRRLQPFEAFCVRRVEDASSTPQHSDLSVPKVDPAPQGAASISVTASPVGQHHNQSPAAEDGWLSPPASPPSPPAATSFAAADPEDPHIYAHQLLPMPLKAFNTPNQADRQACFFVPDWDQAKLQLNLRSFCLPAVRIIELADGQHLTWWCTCDHTL